MNLQETPAGQHFARFSRLYRGRERGIWERGRFEVSENNGVFLPDEVLTVERFVEHASGEGRSYGIHLLDAQNCVNFSMYDMDAHPRTLPAPEMLRQLRMLKPLVLHMCATLYDIGIARENLLLEFSGTGYHLWLFYAEPQPAVEIRAWMSRALVKSAIEGHAFKPVRTEITATHNGDKVWLPLRVNSNQGNRSVFIDDLARFDPGDYDQRVDFSRLDAVVPLSRERLSEITARLAAVGDAVGGARLGG